MSILLNENTRVIIQGITGKLARFHASEMVDYGTKVVAGVVPGRGGEKVDAIPVFNTVKDAVKETGATASLILCLRRLRQTVLWSLQTQDCSFACVLLTASQPKI